MTVEVSLVHKAHRDMQDLLVQLAHKVHKGLLVHRDRRDIQDLLALPAVM
jgi:hypothetical protein